MKILFGLIVALVACGGKDTSGLTGDVAAGEVLYAADCAACHGVDAAGGSGPSLLGEDAEEFETAIPNGHGSMPAFPDYTAQDIADVIAYVHSL